MKSPAFWWQAAGAAAWLLAPFGAVYGALAAMRMGRQGIDPGVPVICVGNFVAGGAGKTPAALAIAGILRESGVHSFFLTRGYGGKIKGPHRVDPSRDGPREVGDEALLLTRAAPVIVAADRAAGGRLAAREGAEVIVMDDGLQNPGLAKTLLFAVVDGETGAGNGYCIPAGPLRAPLGAQLQHVHAVIVVGGGAAGVELGARAKALGKIVFAARLEPDHASALALKGRRVLAFAGIGRPEKFFQSLRACGAEIAGQRAYADHARMPDKEVADLLATARRQSLQLVTTEKDLIRLDNSIAHRMLRDASLTLPITLVFEDLEALAALLRRAIQKPPA